MKKLFGLFISLIIICNTTLSVFAVDTKYRAKLLRTVGDGLNYYVEYEINGRTYRSDQVGTLINKKAWSLFDDEDKMALAKNYSFSPNERVNQFGSGSADITSWVNEKQGWTQAAEILRQRIVNKHYPDLTNYFENPSSIIIGNTNMADISMESVGFLNNSELALLTEYTLLAEKINTLRTVYAAGQASYNSLKSFKTQQISIAVKSISSDLIKLIVDQILVPNVIMSPTGKLSSAFASVVGLIEQQVGITDSLYKKLLGESINAASASEVINDLWKLINNVEEIANNLKDKCESLVSEIEQNIASLKIKELQIIQNDDFKKEEQTIAINTTIAQVVAPIEYIFYSDAETESERTADINNQALIELDEVMSLYNAWKYDIELEKEEILNIIGISGNEETKWQEWGNVGAADTYIVNDGGSAIIALTEDYFPDVIFREYDYNAIKTAIPAQIQTAKDQLNLKINKLKAYDDEAVAFFEAKSETFKTELEPALLGLEEYASYDVYIAKQEGYNLINSIATMQFWRNDFSGATIKNAIEDLEKKINLMDCNYNNFTVKASNFESQIKSLYIEYLEIKTNLENSAYFFVDNYNNMITLRQNFAYGTTQYSANIYIRSLIDSLNGNETKKEEGRRIAEELHDFSKQELDFIKKMNAGKTNTEYHRGGLKSFLNKNLGNSISNFESIVNKTIETPEEIETRIGYTYLLSFQNNSQYNKTITPTSYISTLISDVLGTGIYYEDLDIIGEELNNIKCDLFKKNKEDFDSIISLYRSKLNAAYLSANNNSNCSYTKLALQYHKYEIEFLLNDIETEYFNYVEVEQLTFLEPKGLLGGFKLFEETQTDIQINKDETIRLIAQVEPTNSTEKRIIWSSSDLRIAIVDGDGNITGIANGIATIFAIAVDGGAMIQKTIMVGTGIMPDYYCDDLVLTIENNKIKIGAIINTNSLEDSTVIAIVAIYDEVKLIEFKRVICKLYKDIPHSIDFSKDIGIHSQEKIKVKLLLWSEMSNLMPLIKTVTLGNTL